MVFFQALVTNFHMVDGTCSLQKQNSILRIIKFHERRTAFLKFWDSGQPPLLPCPSVGASRWLYSSKMTGAVDRVSRSEA